jgi:predicted site-specific integrase-resolvase
MNTQNDSFRLYSLNKARQLLGIGRSTLERYINEGLIGVIPQTKNKVKIPHSELQRFMQENIHREKNISILTSTDKQEVTNFINGYKADVDKNFDSSQLFDKLMESYNVKRV